MIGWKQYLDSNNKWLIEARPYVKGENMFCIYFNANDPPKPGDMIVRYSDKPEEQWLVNAGDFAGRYEEAPP